MSFVAIHYKHALFCDKKVMFHNSLNVKMFANMYRKCLFADDILLLKSDNYSSTYSQ